MKAGFCTVEITMPIGCEMAGGYSKFFSERIYGPLKIRTAVFSDGGRTTAFAVVDTSCVDESFIARVLQMVKNICGAEFDAYIISASHVHTGGFIRDSETDKLKACLTPEMFDKLGLKYMPAPVPWYYEYCVNQCASALSEAYYRLEEVDISVGKGMEAGRIFNRRFRLKNGRECTHPGKLNPEIADFAGPVDPEVNVLGAWRKDGSLLGCIVNYGCHGTTMCSFKGSHGDWFQYTEAIIKKLLGDDVSTLIMTGPCGDVTQVNNLSPSCDFGEPVARELGGRVGAEAYKVLLSAVKRSDVSMDCRSKTISVAKRRPSAERLKKALDILESSCGMDNDDAMFARHTVVADAGCRANPESELNVTAVRIGDAAFVSVQAELFCQLGLDIKAGSKFRNTFISTLANGYSVYVPTLKAFDPETGGGYETRLTPGRLDIRAGDMIVENSVEMLNSLSEEKPEEVNFTPAAKVWSYGANRPEIE